jgi:SAM-dependent methyltransferase
MEKKDYFSGHSKLYATFRPTYPEALYQFILGQLQDKATAWDCATGNGQVAQYLARHFRSVYATDISQQQLDNAFLSSNIVYSVAPAESTSFPDDTFDLITVAQALHWLHPDRFYAEVRRTAKRNALLAVWGYALLSVDARVDKQFLNFYHNTTGPYWDESRKLVENQYRDIPFPFAKIDCPAFSIKVNWSLDQFAGYLTSWSATQKFIRVNGFNPVDQFKSSLTSVWNEGEIKPVTFPLFLKLGRVNP